MRFKDIRIEAKKAKAALISVGAEATPPDWQFRMVAQMKMLLRYTGKARNRQMFSLICRENAYAHPVSTGPMNVKAVEFIPDTCADAACNICEMPITGNFLYAGHRLCDAHENRTRNIVGIPAPMRG